MLLSIGASVGSSNAVSVSISVIVFIIGVSSSSK